MMSRTARAHVLVLADVPGWAWDRKAQAYARWLADEFEITVGYHARETYNFETYDLVHCFEVSQLGAVPQDYRGRLLAGLTAHVWRTWGEEQMRAWAYRVDGLHGNSKLLVNELRQFHDRVFYTPNGVDPDFFHRYEPRGPIFTACHVGKPNPRKGGDLIRDVCDDLGVKLTLVQRTSHIRHSWETIRSLYQEAWVQITMSDMDGTPNPMLESAACENALISTPIGNMPEFIVDGTNGYLVDRSKEALAAKLRFFQQYPEAAIALGQEARRTVLRDWTWERQVEHVRAAWREALGG